MESTAIMEFLAPFSENPVLQGTVAALCTFILEDPTTISCGLLVGTGNMNFWAALIGLSIGIALGDIGLYGLGRLLGKRVIKRGWLTPEQLQRGRTWGEGNLFSSLFAARFIPGARFPTYLTAGVLKVSFTRFALFAVLLSVLWTTLLLIITAKLGDYIFQLIGPAKWTVAAIFFVVLTLYIIFRIRRVRREVRLLSAQSPTGEVPPVSKFELWHPFIFYFPVVLYYARLALSHGGVMTPFSANPSIYSSGICRESKDQILSLVPDSAAQYMLKRAVFCKPIKNTSHRKLRLHALQIVEKHGITFPFVAKPDVGQRGAGVQLIRNQRQFFKYLKLFPAGRKIIFQQLAHGHMEAGVFYYRNPKHPTGRILSITLKEFPALVGNGKSTVGELVQQDARARLFAKVYQKRHQDKWDDVVLAGVRFPLVFSGNHCQGSIFKNGKQYISPQLESIINEIGGKMRGFYFGRFDLRYNTLESLEQGVDFQIIEINGASSESTHIWDSTTTISEAYKALFKQFELLFEIGLENRRRGHKPISGIRFILDLISYNKTSKCFPPTS
ncbi:MAG: VTT domain-containing protein [Sumerlaeia bacterium]